jgi:3-hydroxyacyl-[acyl-carrier-protein] dehydratase
VTANGELVADIELMFSHIDKNMSGIAFPEHNFVFTEQFTELLKTYRTNDTIRL